MHLVPDNLGRFPFRPFYPNGEIDAMMEALLDSVGRPRVQGLDAIDIEQVLLRLDREPEYGDLPENLEGVTLFAADGTSKMIISTRLADHAKNDPAALHRLRTTLGHELGHGDLHGKLFLKAAVDSGAQGIALPYTTCGGGQYAGWWEWQANAAMAALLMPQKEFSAAFRRWRRTNGEPRNFKGGAAYSACIMAMADAFQVSREAASIRVEGLKLTLPYQGMES